jgi:hypothetical protein
MVRKRERKVKTEIEGLSLCSDLLRIIITVVTIRYLFVHTLQCSAYLLDIKWFRI